MTPDWGLGVGVFGRDVDVGIMGCCGDTRIGFPREFIGAHPTVQRAIRTRHGNSRVRNVPGSFAVVGAAVTAPAAITKMQLEGAMGGGVGIKNMLFESASSEIRPEFEQ